MPYVVRLKGGTWYARHHGRTAGAPRYKRARLLSAATRFESERDAVREVLSLDLVGFEVLLYDPRPVQSEPEEAP